MNSVNEKTVRTAIKQDLNPDCNLLDCVIWGILKTNATFHPNISLLKTVIEEEWNKMSEEFILKACKSFQRRVDTIIEQKKMVTISSYSFVSFFRIKINLLL